MSSRIFLITGFALDKRAFSTLELPLENFILVDFIPFEAQDTLKSYALRLAEKVGFSPEDMIGGVSLGGMLALEIAAHFGAKKILLISSCSHPRYIRKIYLRLSYLAPLLPSFAIRRGYALIIPILKRKKLLSGNSEAVFYSMLENFSPKLMRCMPRLIRTWQGCRPQIPMAQIHGKGDWLIKPEPGAQLLQTKNHLLTLSHPQAIRAFLKTETGY